MEHDDAQTQTQTQTQTEPPQATGTTSQLRAQQPGPGASSYGKGDDEEKDAVGGALQALAPRDDLLDQTSRTLPPMNDTRKDSGTEA
eukprot:scaffold5443_cov291-Pinguiococcus_pyrenoidosus.AAC.21